MPERMSVVGVDQLRRDLRVLVFSFGLALLTGVLFGLLPALQASKPDMTDTLKQGGRGSAGVRRRARMALVIGEVTLAALTLVGAGLVVRSFSQTMAQPLGFDASQRLTFTLSIPQARYKTAEERRAVLHDLEGRFRSIPGVRSVGAVRFHRRRPDSDDGDARRVSHPGPARDARRSGRCIEKLVRQGSKTQRLKGQEAASEP